MNSTAQKPGVAATTQPSTKRMCCLLIVQIALFSLLAYTTLLPTYNAHAQGEIATIQIVGPTPGFSPALLTVHVLDYVIFINQTAPATNVTIAADDGTFSSPAIASGKQWATTFNSPGAYEYHDTTNPPHMVGEIVVVASSVTLLTTPAPQVEATTIALIQSGKTPPDNLALITPTPTTTTPSRPQGSTTLPLVSNVPPWLIALLLLGESLLLIAICIVSFLLIRSYRHRLRQLHLKNAVELNAPIAEKVGARRKLFHRFKRKNDDDDDEEDYDEA
ncbi:MAG: cupredoxin domain-containing protein [Ktedonobacteraceae bacterium]